MLAEMMVVLAIATLMLSLIGRMFADVWSAANSVVAGAEQHRLEVMIMERWQQEVGGTDPDEWCVGADGFSAGKTHVSVRDDGIVFGDGESARAICLPVGVKCEFTIEKHDSLADCAVLTLRGEREVFRKVSLVNVRMVACGGDKE